MPEEPVVTGSPFPGGPKPLAKESHGLFRKTVHLGYVPVRVPARLTADSRYALFVNGHKVFRGSIRSQPRRMHYDLFDLAPYLQVGKNVLAVYVKYYGTPKSFWQPAVPNMTLGKSGVLVFEADLGDHGWVVSDETWRAKKSDAWESTWQTDADHVSGGIPLEVFDARRLSHNWHELDFDDSDWGYAHFVPAVHIGGFARTQPPTDPYGPLFPRPIAKLGGARQNPARLQCEYFNGQIDQPLPTRSNL